MSFINIFKNVIRAKNKEKHQVLRYLICLFFILVFLLNFLFIINNNSQNYCSDNEDNALKKEIDAKNLDSLKLSQSPDELLQDPFTINFNDIWNFFNSYFKSNLNYDVDLYVSESKSDGVIIDNRTKSKNNLLLYKSLIKEIEEDYNWESTFEDYLDLKSTPLWYQGNVTQFKYGFVKSINGTTGGIVDDKRYLVDNLMPIFLLIENLGDKLDDPFNGKIPEDSVIEMFNLINSSEFWDSNNYGFFESNSSGGEKYIKSNLYAVLANLLIHKNRAYINNDKVTKNASILANNTMRTLINEAWDNANKGFYNSTDSDWTSISGPQQYLYLDVNALGIIALLEYWIMTGMNPSSEYLKNATELYNQISEPSSGSGRGGLWNTRYSAYEYYRNYDWDTHPSIESTKLDLEANALMMQACLKLFEVTGNFSYYQRAFKIREFIEKYLYNNSINAYMTAIYTEAPFTNNTNVNFHKNLKLCEVYLKAVEIYDSVLLDASYIIPGKVKYIMNQDSINLTCTYAFEKDVFDFNGDVLNTIRYDNITGASVTYIFRYPNGTIFKILHDTFINSTTNLIYPINNSLPFGDGYTIYIYANWTYFGFIFTSKTFNVISGLRDFSVEGLGDPLFQGEKTNITIYIFSDYNYNLTLNITMFGDVIKTETLKNITLLNNSQSSFNLSITVNNDATQGNANITFTFKNGTVLYLEEKEVIEIKIALSYSNLIYSNNIVPGDFVRISLDLINFLPNDTQKFNLSFSGKDINEENFEIELEENQRKIGIVPYLVYTHLDIKTNSIEIDMIISKGKTVFYNDIFQKEKSYTQKLTVEIVPSFEIISIEFPEKVAQGTDAYLVILIQNNKEQSEEFSLYVNNKKVKTEIDELLSGENRIEYKFVPTLNPYEFGIKSCHIEIEDDSDNVIVEDYFEYEIELSAFNLIFFYMVPVVVLIGIILHYRSKYLKNKLLRR